MVCDRLCVSEGEKYIYILGVYIYICIYSSVSFLKRSLPFACNLESMPPPPLPLAQTLPLIRYLEPQQELREYIHIYIYVHVRAQ